MQKLLADVYKYRTLIIVSLLSLWGLALRFWMRAGKEIDGDEAFSAQIFKEPFFEFLKKLPRHDFCGYLNGDYYITYPFFQVFGLNKWGLAIPKIAAVILGFYLLYLICKKHLKTTWGFAIAFAVVALNENLVEHALDVRPYGVLSILALLAFWAVDQLFDSAAVQSLGRKTVLGAVLAGVILYHPYGIFIVSFVSLYIFLAKTPLKDMKNTVIRLAPFYAVILALTLPVILWSMKLSGHIYNRGLNVFEFIPHPLENTVGFLKGIFGNLVGKKALYFLLLAPVVSLLLPHKDRIKQMLFVLILVILPIGIIVYLDMKNNYWFLQRQFVWVMPLFAVFLAWCTETVFYRNKF